MISRANTIIIAPTELSSPIMLAWGLDDFFSWFVNYRKTFL
jgi:hypothetical protein